MNNSYTPEFFINLEDGSDRSAKEIVPLVLDLIGPQSVVDVGCGTGSWLSIFKQAGILDCLGIDGDYICPELLKIAAEEFLTRDLKLPLKIDRTFDLVISLEVAEHLPASCAEIFVDSLTRLGDIILFSAAIPYQGGTEHLNEQWLEYWAAHFEACGYVAIDCLRGKIWDNDRVEAWYAQNLLFFVRRDSLENYPNLRREFRPAITSSLARIHPKIYLNKVQSEKQLSVCRPPRYTVSGVELQVNKNRWGCFEVEIIDIKLLPKRAICSGDTFSVEIEYRAKNSVYAPIFSVDLSREDGTKYFETNTEILNLSLDSIRGVGKIKLPLESSDLSAGEYFVNVGVYARHWAYIYDYHRHVYPLSIKSKADANNCTS